MAKKTKITGDTYPHTKMMTLEGESFSFVPETENTYMVSNFGNIISVRNGIKREIKPFRNKHHDYLSVTLCINGNTKRYRLHRLIAIVLIPNPENKPQVNHIDGNKHNNRVDNLEWCTQKYNSIHSLKTGLSKYVGEKSHFAKLTKEQVIDLKFKRIKGHKVKDLAKEFNISDRQVIRICQNKAWSYALL